MKYCLDCNSPKSFRGNYCKKCGYKHRTRPSGLTYQIKVDNKGWFKDKGGWIDEKGYKRLRSKKKASREHRLIMEKFIGRELDKSELVHHIDRNKLNNSIENLMIVSRSEHMKIHHNLNRSSR